MAEAVVWICYIKKVFLKISQNSQENNYLRESFTSPMPQAWNFIKKTSLAQEFSSEIGKFF